MGVFDFRDQGLPPDCRKKVKMFNSKLKSENNSVTGSRNIARWVAKTGILASVAILLMFFEMTIPLMPAFLKFDFSEIK